MKRCGYRPGLCSNPGACHITGIDYSRIEWWRQTSTAVFSCPYYVMVAGSRQMAFNLPRIRPDWDVNDSPDEGKEID